jgi:hypothetical protein
VGDVDGDGYADFVVASSWDDGANTGVGRAFLYLGRSTGVPVTAAWAPIGTQAGQTMGSALNAAGDVNGDGHADFVVGSNSWDGSFTNEGKMELFLGGPDGPSETSSWEVTGGANNAYLADSSRSLGAGDWNGDGYSDLLGGAPGWPVNGNGATGRVFVYDGGPAGLSAGAAASQSGPVAAGQFGYALASAGDVDGDGFDELLVGAPFAPQALPPHLSAAGLASLFAGSASGLGGGPDRSAEGYNVSDYFGWSVAGMGDVDGDGYDDVIVGGSGLAEGYYGSPSGLSSAEDLFLPGEPGWNSFGYSVAGAGDVNRDGYDELLVGSPWQDDGGTDSGAAWLYLGSASGPSQVAADFDWTYAPAQANAQFGQGVSPAGDVNRDGFDDVIVGAPGFSNGQNNEGAALIFLGSASGLLSTPQRTLEGGQNGAAFGTSVSLAGDVNGDSYADVVVGAPLYNVASTADAGAAFAYLGSSSGISSSVAWLSLGATAQGHRGAAVALAGDTDADGYSDVLVGAPDEPTPDSEEGVASLYLGSSAGLANSPAWEGYGDAIGLGFGQALASAGDVDGDGFGDIAVGSPTAFD